MKKTVKNEKFKKALYSACALALCAAALFAFWMSNRNSTGVLPDNSVSETLESTQPTTEDIEVNNPVTNVPDDRVNDNDTSTQPRQNSYFAMPLENGISKEFSGDEIVKNITTDDWRTHRGIDLKGVTGDPVKAINNGVVKEVYDDALWGTVVVIDHYDGLTAEYRGLGKGSTVAAGQTVKINDKVGNLGEIPIEKKDGVHLHLEIYKDGKAVSPSDYIGQTVD